MPSKKCPAPNAMLSAAVSTADIAKAPRNAGWWVYLLACRDGRTYAGIAVDVLRRFRVHQSGKGSKFTRSNPPIAILGARMFADKAAALRAEYALKQLSRSDKFAWAAASPEIQNR
jgi:putative endonuclease